MYNILSIGRASVLVMCCLLQHVHMLFVFFCLSVCLQFALCVQNAFNSAHSHALNTTI